eukprot:5126075-Amphidinium_carterae.1
MGQEIVLGRCATESLVNHATKTSVINDVIAAAIHGSRAEKPAAKNFPLHAHPMSASAKTATIQVDKRSCE